MACVRSSDGDSFKNSKTDEASANFHISWNQKPDAIESTRSEIESVQTGKTSSLTKDHKDVPSKTSIISSDVGRNVSSQLALNLNTTRKIQDQSKVCVSILMCGCYKVYAYVCT